MNPSSSNLFPDSYSTGDYKWMTVESTPLVGSSPGDIAYSDNERSARRKVSFRAQLENIEDNEDEAEVSQSQPTRQAIKRLPSPRDPLESTPSREARPRHKQESTSHTRDNKENENSYNAHQKSPKKPLRKPNETLRDATNNPDLLSDDIPKDFHTGILLSSTPVVTSKNEKTETSGTRQNYLHNIRSASEERKYDFNPDETVDRHETNSTNPSWQAPKHYQQKASDNVAELDIQSAPKTSTATILNHQNIHPPKLAALEIPDEVSQPSTSSSLRSSPSELQSGQPVLTPGNARDHIPLQTPADEVPNQSKRSPGIDSSALINALTEAVNRNVTLESELRRQTAIVTDLRKKLEEAEQKAPVSPIVRNAGVQAAVQQFEPPSSRNDQSAEASPEVLSELKQGLHEILRILRDQQHISKDTQVGALHSVGIQVTEPDILKDEGQDEEKDMIDEFEDYRKCEERKYEEQIQQLESTVNQVSKELEQEREISSQLRGKDRSLTASDMPASTEEERQRIYAQLEMGRVDQMGAHELGNLVKNIMLQLNAGLDKLPLRVQSVRDHLLREELYLHFANDIHKIIYKGQQITRQKLTEEQEIECLGMMVTRVAKLHGTANKVKKIRKVKRL